MRDRLANRRPNESILFDHKGTEYHGAYGLYEDGRVSEIFLDTGKIGSELSFMALAAGITASLYFQHGGTLAELIDALPKLPGNKPADPLGVFLALISAEL